MTEGRRAQPGPGRPSGLLRLAGPTLSGLLLALALLLALPARADSLRTEVLFLERGGLGAERAVTLYQRILGETGESRVTVGRQPNMLVVRDTPERLKRFRALIAALDHPGEGQRLYVRPVVHVAPSALAALIEQTGAFPPDLLSVVPDDRSGHLVVRARLADYRRLDLLLRKLDVAPGDGQRQIRVTPAPSEGGFPP